MHSAMRISYLDDGSCRIIENLEPSVTIFDLREAHPTEASAHLAKVWADWAHSDPPGPP